MGPIKRAYTLSEAHAIVSRIRPVTPEAPPAAAPGGYLSVRAAMRQAALDLGGPLPASGRDSRVTLVQVTVASYYHVRMQDMLGTERRYGVLPQARAVAVSLLRTHLKMSWPEIGRAMRFGDHTTAMSAAARAPADIAEALGRLLGPDLR